MWKNVKTQEEGSQFPKLQSPSSESKSSLSSKSPDRTKIVSTDNQYAIMVSCRCNYTSKFFCPLGLLVYYYYLIFAELLIGCFPLDLMLNVASRLFFKQATSWRPRTSRDIIISVASEISGESPGPYERNSQLPVQVNICFNY